MERCALCRHTGDLAEAKSGRLVCRDGYACMGRFRETAFAQARARRAARRASRGEDLSTKEFPPEAGD